MLKEVSSLGDELLGETFSLFVASQVSGWLMKICRLAATVWYLRCCDMKIRSMTYYARCVFGSVGAWMSCM